MKVKEYICCFLVSSLSLVTGCISNSTFSYVKETQSLAEKWIDGDIHTSEFLSAQNLDIHQSRAENQIVFFLERGAILRAAQRFEDSNYHFQKALDLMDARRGDLIDQSEGSENIAQVGSEVAALLSNINVIPYRGFGYDRIMAHTYLLLNYLALDKQENAQVEANRLYATQQYFVSKEYRNQINHDEKIIERERDNQRDVLARAGVDLAKLDDGMVGIGPNHSISPAYAPFVNPFSTYIYGLIEAAKGNTENAKIMLKRVTEFTDNNYIKQDLEELDKFGKIENITYVFFESNTGLFRDEKHFETVIPVPVKANIRGYNGEIIGSRTENLPLLVAFSWPVLKRLDQPYVNQSVLMEGGEIKTELIADMESIIAKEFDIHWPAVRNKIALSVLAKTAGAVYLTKTAGALGAYGASLYQSITRGTDSRTWRTLPSNFQISRFKTPASRILQLDALPNEEPIEVPLIEGKVNVVYIKQNSPNAPRLIHQFKLK